MERLRITINFKNTKEDIELYNELKKYSCVSGYVKDVLRGVLNITEGKGQVASNKAIESVNEDISEDISDILGG